MSNNDQQVSFDDEMLILVDENDNIIGYENKLACHRGEGLLHRAFSIFIFNDRKELLLQQRSEQKHLWPLYWSNSCCSHPRKGEDLENATQRRLAEELGISTPLKHLFTFQYHARYKNVGSEREVCAVLIGKSNDPISVNPTEIADWKYIGINELTQELAKHPEKYTPWLKMEWERLMVEHLDDIMAL
ncbi:MAG: isopentenyl-diphosphate Delta-isomerase [Calditrichaeota bacterium]|nr:MAG: isopentenyl-diphosphate Delta-isomerase [Calditrichota bacterium]